MSSLLLRRSWRLGVNKQPQSLATHLFCQGQHCYSTSGATTLETACYVSQSTNPYTNLAIEEWLLRHHNPKRHVLYLWRNRPCVVIGRNQNPWKECNLTEMARKDIWLVRRQSGGGTVYHDLGNSLYTVIMPRDKFSRRFSAELVTRALHMLDIPARVNDRHDIVIGDRKISGSAFKIIRDTAFHHGTMLIHSDLGCLAQTLHNDRASIVTKGVESVRSPVTKLNEFSLTVDHQAFCEAVTDEFNRTYNVAAKHPPVYLDDTVIESIPQIVAYRDKLQSWDWLYGQTPEFTNTLHFDATWGTVGIVIKARHGAIQRATFSTEQRDSEQQGIWAQLSTALQGIRYNPKDVRVVFEQLIRELPLFEARGRNQLLDTLAYLEGRL